MNLFFYNLNFFNLNSFFLLIFSRYRLKIMTEGNKKKNSLISSIKQLGIYLREKIMDKRN